MLISFAVSNHRSIRERVELSLVAEKKPTAEGRATLHVPGFELAVVPVVAIVGPNGSGKSNVVDALAYAASAIVQSQGQWDPDEPPPRAPFKTASGPLEGPSVFEFTFAVDACVYEYSFAVGAEAIESERLLVARRGPRSWSKLFERHTYGNRVEISYGRSLAGPRAAAEAATRPNSLFLSAAAQNNHPELSVVRRWVRDNLRMATLGTRAARAEYTARRIRDADDEYRARLRKFICSADLGLRDVSVREVPLPEDHVDALRKVLAAAGFDEGSEDFKDLKDLVTTFEHSGDVGSLELSEESAGTRVWFEWAAPVIDALDYGQVLGADELDAHLNRYLAAEIVRAFQSAETNRREAQLIFNAQDPALLSIAGIARDQAWITQKNEHGATMLIPVTEFSPQRRWDIGNAYSHGRFGGLPVVDEETLARALLPAHDKNGGAS